MEYKIGDRTLTVERGADGEWLVDGRNYVPDITEVEPRHYHVILGEQGFRLRFLKREGLVIFISVNGKELMLNAVDPRMSLLEQLGIDMVLDAKPSGVIAPMPGKVLEVMAKEGQDVKKGDSLLILEAMKMENIIKAPQDATVSSVNVSAGDSVEKGADLIGF